ncbi:MAG: hypothetical protein Q8K18_15150 [Burkholderiales bacterium]|nr:hypothetical protein [Burkholderiales bacterium]
MNMEVPIALKLDHDELRAELDKALNEHGPIGEAAHQLASIILPHMAMEEKIAFPALGLLPELASGDVTAEMAAILPLISEFISRRESFQADHRRTAFRLQMLLEAAKKAGSDKYTQFAYRGMVHERIEEAVIYPAIVLIGKYIQQQLKR